MLAKISKPFALILILAFLVSACQPSDQADGTASPVAGTGSTPTPVFTPIPPAARTLNICLGDTPNSLYPLGGPNGAARSVLAAIYDGPFDLLNYEYQPVTLTKMPSLADGDAQINTVSVGRGDEVQNAAGELILLDAGARVRPAGCRADNCVVTFDGNNPITMDYMFVQFKLKPGLRWSDGTPLTAEDSVYAFEIASNDATPGTKYVIERTRTYEAADEVTVQWWGKPGFVDPTYYTNFWAPLPKHIWGQFSAKDLLTSDISARTPMGNGAYVIKTWTDTEIRLTKNTNYFRAAEGLPYFDELVFQITPDPDMALSALIEGRCDLIDSTVHLDTHTSLLLEMRRTGQLRALFGETPTMEWLALGVNPASYDDAYDPNVQRDRPDFFGDPRLRVAIAQCLDRQKVVDTVLYGLVSVPDTYISASHPLHATGLPTYTFNPAAGMRALDNLGWRDHDNNPATARVAIGVDRVPPNTKLVITYSTTSITQRRQVSEILGQSLIQCGIGLTITYLPQLDFYAEGPGGLLFGRKFDLAEFAMSTFTPFPPCERFTSAEIPNALNRWIGANVSGYKNPTFDSACLAARTALPDEAAYLSGFRQTQLIFSTDLPAIPLYNRIETAAARADFCNVAIDPTASTDLWSIETYDYGAACQP